MFCSKEGDRMKRINKIKFLKLIDLNLLIIEKVKILNSKIKSSIYGDGNATEKIASLVKKLYERRKILITGCAGFIGFSLARSF